MQLIVERSRMCEILGFAERLAAERDAVIELVLELPIVLKLQAVYRRSSPTWPTKSVFRVVLLRPTAYLARGPKRISSGASFTAS